MVQQELLIPSTLDGGHELDMTAAAHWILTQYGKKQHVTVTG